MNLYLNKNDKTVLYPSLQTRKTDTGQDLPHEIIPPTAREFYHDFGSLIHPRTGEQVPELADYQYKVWDDKSKYRLVIKSQKVGLSTSCLLEDFQKAITTCKGKDILVIAQTQDQANEHLLTLKTLIVHSPKYSKYLIRESGDLPFKEEKTKLNAIFIKNPEDKDSRTRILGKGPSEAALWSWRNVAHIHMSDIAANKLKDDSPVFAAAFSRLMSTSGSMLIETPPRGPFKKTFEIYQQSLSGQKKEMQPATLFSIHHVTAQEAVNQGVIDQETLDGERSRLGPTLYSQNYEAQFLAASGNLFNQGSIDKAISLQYNPDAYSLITAKVIAVDQGYINSKFAIIVAERDYKTRRLQILKAEEVDMPLYEEMMNKILRYRTEYGNVVNIFVDATSRQEFVMSLKLRIGEAHRWPYVTERLEYAKKNSLNINEMMSVVPIIFSRYSKDFMSSHARRVLDDPRQLIAIDPRFVHLITGLRTAVFDEAGMLDKELTAHDDLVDCFQMLTTYIQYVEKRK